MIGPISVGTRRLKRTGLSDFPLMAVPTNDQSCLTPKV